MERASILICVGFLFATSGTLLSFSWDSILDLIIKTEVPISSTSKTYPTWKRSTTTLNFYLFNWTNPKKEFEKNYKPEFVELGPYTYKQVYEKVNVTWNANHTVTYQRLRNWYFDSENSNGSLSDNVTMLNVVAVSSNYITRHWSPLSTFMLSTTLRMLGQSMWVTKSVREVMFEGYDDPILKMMSLFSNSFPGNKFAWILNRNGSYMVDGVLNVGTAAEDITKLGIIHSWNYKSKSDFFEAGCIDIRGSVGDLFPPIRTKNLPLYLFSPDFCRDFKFEYLEETEVHRIPTYRYEASKTLIDNGTMDPATRCNCVSECLPVGVFNISACRFGSPVFVSFPHFYNADPYYLRQLKGLKPDAHLHRSLINLEPKTGIPLDIQARFQVNLLLQPSKTISMFRDMPTILFPMMWFEELGSVQPADAVPLRRLLLVPVLGPYFSVGLMSLGLVMITVNILSRMLDTDPWKMTHILKRKPSKIIRVQAAVPNGFIRVATPDKEVASSPPEECALLNTNPKEASVK